MSPSDYSDCRCIAVAGKMASGKNYITSQFEKAGWLTLDADILVHEAIIDAKDEILDAFALPAAAKNINIQNSDGSINRKALGSLLFSDSKLLKKQEEIVFKIITERISQILTNNKDKQIVLNATLIYKTPQLLLLCERILYVKAPFFTRLKRAKQRDNLSTKEILKRFYTQRFLYQKYKKIGLKIDIINNK